MADTITNGCETRSFAVTGSPGLDWRKSSRTLYVDKEECIAVATSDARVHVADTKNPGLGAMTVPAAAFEAFLATL